MRVVTFLRSALVAIALVAAGLAEPVLAQDANTRIIVPDLPGGALLSGCYRVNQRLYGPYRMEFCLEQRGSYTVTGGGVQCDGRLNWSARGSDVSITLAPTSCGNGVAWSADRMSCRGDGLFRGILARIIAPNLPVLGGLRCTYTPSTGGQPTVAIVARRTS